jgi:hypothetical protein
MPPACRAGRWTRPTSAARSGRSRATPWPSSRNTCWATSCWSTAARSASGCRPCWACCRATRASPCRAGAATPPASPCPTTFHACNRPTGARCSPTPRRCCARTWRRSCRTRATRCRCCAGSVSRCRDWPPRAATKASCSTSSRRATGWAISPTRTATNPPKTPRHPRAMPTPRCRCRGSKTCRSRSRARARMRAPTRSACARRRGAACRACSGSTRTARPRATRSRWPSPRWCRRCATWARWAACPPRNWRRCSTCCRAWTPASPTRSRANCRPRWAVAWARWKAFCATATGWCSRPARCRPPRAAGRPPPRRSRPAMCTRCRRRRWWPSFADRCWPGTPPARCRCCCWARRLPTPPRGPRCRPRSVAPRPPSVSAPPAWRPMR